MDGLLHKLSIKTDFWKIYKSRPGDNVVNGVFIFVYVIGIYFVTVQPISYFARTDDRLQEVAPGVCEFIQACIYNVTIISVFVYRKEFKQLVEDLESVYEGLENCWWSHSVL